MRRRLRAALLAVLPVAGATAVVVAFTASTPQLERWGHLLYGVTMATFVGTLLAAWSVPRLISTWKAGA